MSVVVRGAAGGERPGARRSRPALAGALAALSLALGGCLSVMPMLAPNAKDVEPGLSADFPFESRFVEVLGSRMHRHPDDVRGLVFMEALMRPMSWDTANAAERYLFGRFRDPEDGHRIIAEDNWFVESMLPMATGRELSDEERAAYRAPYPTVESRRPVARWPLEIPLDGVPADNARRIGANWDWLRGSDVPVLLLHAEPGMIVKAELREQLEAELPRMEVRSTGSGIHYVQETQPTRIGTVIADWLEALS